MKIVVTGSRKLADGNAVRAAFERLWRRTQLVSDNWYPQMWEWHHGGAEGVDAIVDDAIRDYGSRALVHYPDYGRFGTRAPHIRNDEMLDLKPDYVIAIWNGEDGGTRSVIEKAAKRGIPVIVEVVSS